MTDYINKKVNFTYSKISVKINRQIYYSSSSKVFLCSDLKDNASSYCIKISSARIDDKFTSNCINTEIVTLVRILLI